MIPVGKLIVMLAGLGLVGLFGVREYKTACGPKLAMAEQGHGHGGHGEEDAGHGDEGFMARVCETGLLAALKGSVKTPETLTAAKAQKAKPDDHGHSQAAPKSGMPKDDHEHKAGDSHEHGKEQEKKADTAVAGRADKTSDGHDHGQAGGVKAGHDTSAMKSSGEKSEKKPDGHDHGGGGHSEEGGEGLVKLTAAQIQAAGIAMAPALSGTLSKEITVPGRITLNANAQAKVVPKLAGTVASVLKQAGDMVAKGDVLATLESREMAEAKSEYLAATRTKDLTSATLDRERRLWKQKVTAEQDYLNAKNADQEVALKIELAHQKLHALGIAEDEIEKLPKLAVKDLENSRLYDLRSPISGRILDRTLILGQVVGTDREVFSIADLSKVWVEISVTPQDLPFAQEGQDVVVTLGPKTAKAKVLLVNPMIDPETRAAKVVAELDNAAGEWRLGAFVSARLLSGKQEVGLLVPREAIQTIKGSPAVFVSEGAGFRMKPVTLGREDSQNVEVLSGLEFAETVATKNTFTLKAELGKAEAEHEH